MLKVLFNGWTKDGFLKLSYQAKQNPLDKASFYRIYRAVTEANLRPEPDQWVQFNSAYLNLSVADFWLKLYAKDYEAVARYLRSKIDTSTDVDQGLFYSLLVDCILMQAYTPPPEDFKLFDIEATEDKYKIAAACLRKAIALGEDMAIYKLAKLALTKKYTLTAKDFSVCGLPYNSADIVEEQAAALLVAAGQKGIGIAINDLVSFLVLPGLYKPSARHFAMLGLPDISGESTSRQLTALSIKVVQLGEPMGFNTLSMLPWSNGYIYSFEDFQALNIVRQFTADDPVTGNIINAGALARASWQHGLPSGLLNFALANTLSEIPSMIGSYESFQILLEEVEKVLPEETNLRMQITQFQRLITQAEQATAQLERARARFKRVTEYTQLVAELSRSQGDERAKTLAEIEQFELLSEDSETPQVGMSEDLPDDHKPQPSNAISLVLSQVISSLSGNGTGEFAVLLRDLMTKLATLNDPTQLNLAISRVRLRTGSAAACRLTSSDCDFLGIPEPRGQFEPSSALHRRAVVIGNGILKMLAFAEIRGLSKTLDATKQPLEFMMLCEAYFRLTVKGRNYFLHDISLVHLPHVVAPILSTLLPEQKSYWGDFERNYHQLADRKPLIRDFILPYLINLPAEQAPEELLGFFRIREHKIELTPVLVTNIELFAKDKEKLVDNNTALGQIINFELNIQQVLEPNKTKASQTLIREFRIREYGYTSPLRPVATTQLESATFQLPGTEAAVGSTLNSSAAPQEPAIVTRAQASATAAPTSTQIPVARAEIDAQQPEPEVVYDPEDDGAIEMRDMATALSKGLKK